MIKHNPLLLISLVVLLLVSSPSQAAIEFDGSDDQIVISTNYGLGTANTTIATWAYLDSISEDGAFVKIGGLNAGGYAIGVGGSNYDNPGNNFIMLFESIRWIDTNIDIGLGWHHIAMVINGAGIPEGFIDGSSLGQFPGSVTNVPGNQTTIGGYTFGSVRFTDCSLDDVRIYNRALTASEIEVLYNAKRKRVGGSVANGMVAHYEMDGGEIGSAVSTVIDASGNSNHGTGNGGASLKFIEGVVQR